ncbi:MAG: glycoside hydrolase family 97 protein [Planctomycetia bacterium]
MGIEMFFRFTAILAIWVVTLFLVHNEKVHGEQVSSIRIGSPDGKNLFTLKYPGKESGRSVTFSVARNGRAIIEPSELKIKLADKGNLTTGAKLLDVKENHINETFNLPWGKCSVVHDKGNWARLQFKSASGVFWFLEVRACDDGIAFRYELPKQPTLQEMVLQSEDTEYRFAGNPTVLFTTLQHFTTSHESLYQQKPLDQIPVNKLIEMPLLAEWTDGTSAVLTEARLRDFAGMYLQRSSNQDPVVLHGRLSPLPAKNTDKEACVIAQTPQASPWRVIFLADHPGKHLESNLLLCLNDPPKGDYSWAKPGKTTWHWWNGPNKKGLPFKYGMNYETHKYYIDFCARHDIPYHALVFSRVPWYVQSGRSFGPDASTDICRARPELKMPELLAYAKQRGVGIRLWVHWSALDKQLEKAFTQYEAWGIRGLMVDFLNRDDQEMVQFCERVLESAARHKLTIQFHGSYKPSGEQRTFPNLFNREAVLSLEYLKWSKTCTPQHNVNVAYTRQLAGPVDYHLGGFRSVTPEKFEPHDDRPNVLGTRCHHLGLYLIYENPLPMISDEPSAYEGQPGFEFIKKVPVTWDETRFLKGKAGQYVVMARRQGDVWYLGGINNQTKRLIRIPLNFLDSGEYDADMFLDAAEAAKKPNLLRSEHRKVTAADVLEVTMASGGGFVTTIQHAP